MGATHERDALTPAIYAELRKLARARLAGGARSVVLDTTALVHETFLRLQGAGKLAIEDRGPYLAYAASAMRSIVIDFVRRRQAEKHGGGIEHITLDTALGEVLGASDDEILDVHDALESLARIDARLVKVVEMRYFAGLSDDEVGAALGITGRTVRRDWDRARLLLAGMLARK
jgi:RNA polymerase sigma factor (TIGR02999 family)